MEQHLGKMCTAAAAAAAAAVDLSAAAAAAAVAAVRTVAAVVAVAVWRYCSCLMMEGTETAEQTSVVLYCCIHSQGPA